MSEEIWKEELRRYFDTVRIIERAKAETLESFDQFSEFIAEPAFESLAEELKDYGIRIRFRKDRGLFIKFRLSFPGSRIDNFFYTIVLPRNSYELRLGLVLKGRRRPGSVLEEKKEEFMKGLSPAEIIKIDKERLIQDILQHYRDFNFAALTSPE